MKQIFVSSLLFCSLLAACATSKRTYTNAAPFPREPENAMGSDANVISGEFPQTEAVEPSATPAAAPKPTPVPTPQPRKREAVYAIAEPGKQGYARSPYHPEAGLIDCRGLPPGMEIKDPFTEGKNILVP
ncbi:MAG: hypothetical protein WCH57_10365 [Verrucomicrobiota bacterium]